MTAGATERAVPGQGRSAWVALTLLCTALFIDVMSSTSTFTAGPALELDLGLTQTGLQWSFTAATLPAGACLLAGGRLADRFGRRRMFMVGMALLSVSSAACGFAPSVAWLLAARAGQGVAGAVLLPAALALVVGGHTEGPQRRRAIAAWSAIGGVGATAGLLLGGLVTEGLGWRWVFWVNVPVGLVVLFLSPLFLHEPTDAVRRGTVNVAGTVTVSAALGLVVYAVGAAPARGWASLQVLGLAALAAVLTAVWLTVERRSPAPMLPARLLGATDVLRGNGVLVVAGMLVDGLLFTLTLYIQRGLGFSALQFGAVTAAVMTVASVGAAWAAQRLVGPMPVMRVAGLGLALLGAACLLLLLTTEVGSPLPLLLCSMLVFGSGMGVSYVAGSVASLTGVPEEHAGVAAALQTVSFTLGAALGVAALSTAAASAGGPSLSSGGPDTVADGARAAFATGAVIALVGFGLTGRRHGPGPRRRPPADAAPGASAGTGAVPGPSGRA